MLFLILSVGFSLMLIERVAKVEQQKAWENNGKLGEEIHPVANWGLLLCITDVSKYYLCPTGLTYL